MLGSEPCRVRGVVDRNAAGLEHQRLGLAKVEFAIGGLDRPGERAAGMVVEDREAVTAGNAAQAAVLERAVVQADPDGQDVVVRMRVEGIVLVPFDRAADFGDLEIELVVAVADAVVAQERVGQVEQGVRAHYAVEHLRDLGRVLEPPQARLIGGVAGLEIEDGVVLAHRPRFLDEAGYLVAQFLQDLRGKNVGHGYESAFTVFVDLGLGEHGRALSGA